MSRPDLAVVAVERLKALGYETMVELPAKNDTSSFVSAPTTEKNVDTNGVATLVLEMNHGAVELPDGEEDPTHP